VITKLIEMAIPTNPGDAYSILIPETERADIILQQCVLQHL
jgi:hypothetical protein